MLPTFCRPTIWAISLEFCRRPSILEADDFLGACYRKAMTPQQAMDFTFSDSGAQKIGRRKVELQLQQNFLHPLKNVLEYI